tara:strand:+ start:6032 stop:7804 length:1773 start_codon:yes stop_codon:yes gene_type:complete
MYLWILVVGSFAAFYNAWGIGANDCANSFATSVGAKVLTLKKAIIIASIFEFLGAFLMGSHVTSAIRKKIVSYEIFEDEPGALMFGMLCCNISAGIWLNLATYFKFPVSTTHSIIGAILGFALAYGGSESVLWEKVGMVIASWVLSPVLAGIFSLSIYTIIKKYVFNSSKPVENTILIFPILTFFTFLINSFFIFYKGTPQLKLDKLDLWVAMVIAFSIAIITSFLSWYFYIPYAKKKMLENRQSREEEQQLQEQQSQITNGDNDHQYNQEDNDNILVLDNCDQLNEESHSDISRTSNYRMAGVRETNLDTVIETNNSNETNNENKITDSNERLDNDEKNENYENNNNSSSSRFNCFGNSNNERKLAKQNSYKINNNEDDIYLNDLSIIENIYRLKNYIKHLLIKEKASKIELLHKNAVSIDPDAEQLCSSLQVITACFSSFAHGANDVANSIAPYATIYSIYESESVSKKMDVPLWVLFIGGFGIVIGLATWGYKIIDRIGQELTKITPSRGFIIELSAALTTLIASRAELPVSTTHCQIGSVIGCGIGDNKNNIEWSLTKDIVYSWIITLPATGFLSAALFSFGYYAP